MGELTISLTYEQILELAPKVSEALELAGMGVNAFTVYSGLSGGLNGVPKPGVLGVAGTIGKGFLFEDDLTVVAAERLVNGINNTNVGYYGAFLPEYYDLKSKGLTNFQVFAELVGANTVVDANTIKNFKTFVQSLPPDLQIELNRRGVDVTLFPDEVLCFPAHTPIAISLSETRPISDIRVGDTVLAFDPAADLGRGALMPRKCSIPDDHIDPRRSALFMARSILREVREGVGTC